LTAITFNVVDSLSGLDKEEWNVFTGANPVVSYDFLDTLHSTRCASRKTGWMPQYLVLRRNGRLAGAMPLYAKSHSRGEYVFDYSWADAFERHGIPYYPKLLSAVPFTPVTGPRLLARTHEDRVLLARAAIELVEALGVSSLHVLFPDTQDIQALQEAGFMLREGVQFHWDNAGYKDFDAFLEAMKKEKRKKIRQERRKVAAEGVAFRHWRGSEIDDGILDFFYRCYASTYRNHYSTPYLTPKFFHELRDRMPDNLLVIVAEQDGKPIASALNLIGGDTMYGRYWGALKFVSGLHFETCYLQGIEYCIRNSIGRFEGGAQGEHKMSRGLLPTATWSAHWIADERFADAIKDFLRQETRAMNRYIDEMEEHTPFKALEK
jgi:uncharacterized protein